MRFENQVGLVVGATGGIGGAVARRLAAEGARLGLMARSAEPLAQLAGELDALALPGDATVLKDLEAAVAALLERHGRIDLLVHAVGSIKLAPVHLAREADLIATWHLNTLSPMLAMRAAIPAMIKGGGGSIVCCSSVAGSTGLPNHEPIAAAKGGLDAVVRSAAMTYAAQRVRVNAVAFGLVDTPLAAPLLNREAARTASVAMHPLGRVGTPEEAAEAIAFVLGASWMTGAVVPLDGGMAAGRHRHG